VKVLNLDQLAKHTKSITLGGKEYVIHDMTVEQFIEAEASVNRLKDSKDPVVQLKETIALIHRAIPDAPVELLNRLSIEQVGALMSFINGEMDAQVAPEQSGNAQAVPAA